MPVFGNSFPFPFHRTFLRRGYSTTRSGVKECPGSSCLQTSARRHQASSERQKWKGGVDLFAVVTANFACPSDLPPIATRVEMATSGFSSTAEVHHWPGSIKAGTGQRFGIKINCG
jgi:hypothetical protein